MSARANIGPHIWTRQPQYLAPVARSDLARGLVLLWNGATPQFAQVGGIPTTFNNAAPSRPGFQARTPPFNGSNVDVRWNRAVTGTNPSEVTMFARCYLAAAGAEYTIMGMSRSSSANPLFRIQRNGTGFWQAQFRGDGATFTNVSGGSAPTSYRVYDIVGVFRSGTGQKELWIDGLQIATSTTDIGTITLDQTEIGSLVRNSAAQFWDGGIFVAGIYNRALSAGEIAALSENPWQLFMPPRRRLYIGEAATGGANQGSGTGTATDSAAGEGYALHYGSGTSSAADAAAGEGYVLHYGSGAATASATSTGVGEAPSAVNEGSGTATASASAAGEGYALHYGSGAATAASASSAEGYRLSYGSGTASATAAANGTGPSDTPQTIVAAGVKKKPQLLDSFGALHVSPGNATTSLCKTWLLQSHVASASHCRKRRHCRPSRKTFRFNYSAKLSRHPLVSRTYQ